MRLTGPASAAPMRLAHLHWSTPVGSAVEIEAGARWPVERLGDVVTGAGFAVTAAGPVQAGWRVRATRVLSLPDTVGPRMKVLTCGLNPAIYAAERGIGFARGSNRFWRAVVAAGLTDRERDPEHALVAHGIGMTDLAKRATVASAEVSSGEYQEGFARVSRLSAWLRPRVVVFVGLEGWRAAVAKDARAGLQPTTIGGRPAYVMPSTSGLNAHARMEDLVEHLRAAAALA